MTSKSKQIIMAAIGAYLVYTGISLVQDTIAGEPNNQILFILVGVFFALFGLATIIWNIKIIVKETKTEIQGRAEETEEAETDGETPAKVSLGKGVVDVHVGADTTEEKKPEEKDETLEEKTEDAEKAEEEAEADTDEKPVKDEEKDTETDNEDAIEEVPEEDDKKEETEQKGEV